MEAVAIDQSLRMLPLSHGDFLAPMKFYDKWAIEEANSAFFYKMRGTYMSCFLSYNHMHICTCACSVCRILCAARASDLLPVPRELGGVGELCLHSDLRSPAELRLGQPATPPDPVAPQWCHDNRGKV